MYDVYRLYCVVHNNHSSSLYNTFSLFSSLYNIWGMSTGGMRSIELVRWMYSCIIIGKSQFLKNIQIGVKINKITFFCENSGVVALFNFLLAPLWNVFL